MLFGTCLAWMFIFISPSMGKVHTFLSLFSAVLRWTSVRRELVDFAKNENKIRTNTYHFKFIVAHLSFYLPRGCDRMGIR